jgi:Cu(I)/Ag(I) efflux system membrane fusion protein
MSLRQFDNEKYKDMKNILKLIKQHLKLILAVLAFGLIFGYVIGKSANRNSHGTHPEESGHNHELVESQPEVWTCSMHPQIKQDKPGLCPICAMDLIPLTTMTSADEDFSPNEIQMTESAAKLADIKTMVVTKGSPEKSVYLQGKVQADERNISELTARFGGRIEQLFVNFTGQNVKKGQKLATIYSPDLVTAQKELLEALSYKDSYNSLYIAAKGKLKLWDLSDEQIKAIEKKGKPQLYFEVLSPIGGTVMMRHVAIGDYVKEGMPLFKVVDLTKVWVMFDAYESDLPWINLNDEIRFSVQSHPGKEFSGKVNYIDPFLNAKTRVAQVRVELTNKNMDLKPEMFTSGILNSRIAENSSEILIPKSSILWTGKRAVIYVKVPNRENPSFLYREITLGPEAGNFYMVYDGLDEGEEIAVNGVFKIDAASQLQGLPSMMNPDGGVASTGHNHGGTTQKNSSKMEMEIKPLEAPSEFKKQMGELIKSYLQLKDAFVATDEKLAESAAQTALSTLGNIDMSLLKGDAHNQWMTALKTIDENLNGVVAMKGIEMKRSHFSIVSNKLTEVVKSFGFKLTERGTLYLQFCPMAFDDQGGYWLSSEEEIRNPYFGDMMLKCGEVKETIKSNNN